MIFLLSFTFEKGLFFEIRILKIFTYVDLIVCVSKIRVCLRRSLVFPPCERSSKILGSLYSIPFHF